MKRLLLPAAIALLLVTAVWVAISWMEAEKEVRILCGQFVPGTELHDVIRQLETGNYLQYTVRNDVEGQSITFDSFYNLRTTRCSVGLEAQVVRYRRYHAPTIAQSAAYVATAGFTGLALFQLLLALGAPLGHLAWGGRHRRLPPHLRVGSLAAIGILAFGAVCVLEQAGVVHGLGRPVVARTAVWVLVGLFTLSTAGNLASRSTRSAVSVCPLRSFC